MKGTCAILDGEIITSPRSPPDSTVVYQLGLPKFCEIEYKVFFVNFCFYHDVLQPFKAVMYFNFYFFYASFAAIKQLQNAPPHLFFRNRAPSPCPSPQPRVLPDSPSIVHADFQLIVVCNL